MSRAETPRQFRLRAGVTIANKYRVLHQLGRGWEGEVYRVAELATGIERAAKLFYPLRDPRGRVSAWYARKLDRLRRCPILIPYLTSETLTIRGEPVRALISELVEGEVLSRFIRHQPGHRLSAFEGLVFLHRLAMGLESIHAFSDYHGDLHEENLVVRRVGVDFDLRLVDAYRWSGPRRESIREDIVDAVRLFHFALGGQARYARQPPEVKAICRGLRKTLILRRFPTATALRRHLESFEWQSRR
ncbi:MAG: serine/threonine protein kinase [Gammaproteobacteria bacterium]|nr:serine/threonine protein kinase [Gammaproteobacteria bacterium]